MTTPRLTLAHLPTPIDAADHALEVAGVGGRLAALYVKRDDMTGGVEAGNKVRKLEYLAADALERKATALITCGGIQSNHARATAAVAARLGLRAVLLLRTTEPELRLDAVPLTGNLFLDRLLGAEVRLITVAQYRERNALMRDVATELAQKGERPYIIPEGGSNGLGALGYVEAMREVRAQLDASQSGGPRSFDVVIHACGSGGTAAGVALGAARYGVAGAVVAMAVCDDRRTFEDVVARIVVEARAIDPELTSLADLTIDDRAKGPMYGVASEEQKELIVRVARKTGLVFDPVYTGKAFAGLITRAKEGALDGKRVLFIHTGGLPGLLAQAGDLETHARH